MPGAAGRTRGRPRKTAIAPAATEPINSFARVSKQTTAGKDLTTPPARKRKAARSPEPAEDPAYTPTLQRKTLKPVKKARLLPQQQEEAPAPATPRAPTKSKKRALSPAGLQESPRTREAGNLFKRLRIDSSPAFAPPTRAASLLSNASTTRTGTPSSSSCSQSNAASSALTTPDPEPLPLPLPPLPQELLDLVALYAAFLKTLTLHYAHNGSSTPVDLRDISQAVSLAWGKRRISLADVRRCLGIMDVENTNHSPFSLFDYGSKKVCIELREAHKDKPLAEARLVDMFEANLRGIWDGVKDVADEDMKAFVLGLPKAPIQVCESVAKAAAVVGKGQRVLAEFKADIAAKKEKEAAAAAAAATTTTNDGPKLSLIERLRLKESQLALLAETGPTAAQLERRAALQRAEDVAAVVAMLAKSSPGAGMGGRVSFTMPVLMQKLKDSLRLPISKEEGTTCVRLLAAEVAPEWLRIVKIGAKENVVITTMMTPSVGAVAERVKKLSG